MAPRSLADSVHCKVWITARCSIKNWSCLNFLVSLCFYSGLKPISNIRYQLISNFEGAFRISFLTPPKKEGQMIYRGLILVETHKCLLLIMGLHIFEIVLIKFISGCRMVWDLTCSILGWAPRNLSCLEFKFDDTRHMSIGMSGTLVIATGSIFWNVCTFWPPLSVKIHINEPKQEIKTYI